MAKTRIQELEEVLLDQIEKLNDDSVCADDTAAQILIDRSRSIAELTNSFVSINRMKLDVVKEMNKGGTLYEKYLGIESDSAQGKVLENFGKSGQKKQTDF